MRASAFIRTTAKGHTSKATVYFRVRDVNCDIKVASELSIYPQYWDAHRQGYKVRVSLVPESKRNAFDQAVQEILALIANEYFIGADSDWLKKLIFVYHHPNAYKMQDGSCMETALVYWLQRYSEQKLTDPRQRHIYRHLTDIVKRFETYRQKIEKNKRFSMNIDTMTATDLKELEQYIVHEHEYFSLYPQLFTGVAKGSARGVRSQNYVNGLMGRIRTAFNWTYRQGATKNRPFDRYEMSHMVYGTPYYLTVDERNAVFELDLSDNPQLAQYRDVFIFQCLIGCRFGDLVRLTAANIVNGAIEYIPHKTREKNPRTVRVPLNEKARIVLERLMNKQHKTPTIVPHNALSKYNEAIRQLLTLANVTRNVPVVNPKTREEEMKPINTIASSHMARRVFVGNLYKQVKDPNLVASMSGHVEGSHAFARYRTIDDDMKKELVNLIN